MDQDIYNSDFATSSSINDAFGLVLDNEDDKDVDTSTEERKSKEKFNVECLCYELQVGYRILSNLMGAGNRCVNKLFLYPIDDTFPETADYYDKIKQPMWMFKMKEKFEKQEYKDLPEFMCDFRLMIENCYRYNGPDNSVSKKAQKLEVMMKQKVALLSRDLRDKISSASAPNSDDDLLALAGLRRKVRNPNACSDDPSQQLLSQLRRDREMQEKVGRRQKAEDRKAMELARMQELQEWEDKLIGPEVKEQISAMWELPQIGLFVYLCMESLGLEEEVTQYQIERGLAIPRECSDFKRLMTCLLSTPHQRKSLKSFMPYNVWNAKLSQKLDYFYKVLSDNNDNQVQTCFVLGLDTRAFKVMGKCNPMIKKQFHELSYLKRVWILKNFCDFCLETQPYLQKTIEDTEAVRPMDVREVQLGSDGRGNCYINFPMFTGKDIRIYKHSKHQEPTRESLHMEDWAIETAKVSASMCSTPVGQRTSHVVKAQPTSARARALLQAAKSKDTSPGKETPKVTVETPSAKSSSNSWSSSSKNDDSAGGKHTSAKKQKRTGLYFSKRKRLKPDKKGGLGNVGKEDKSDYYEKPEKDDDEKMDVSQITSEDSAVSIVCDSVDTVVNSSSHAPSNNPLSNERVSSSSTDTYNCAMKSESSILEAVDMDISKVPTLTVTVNDRLASSNVQKKLNFSTHEHIENSNSSGLKDEDIGSTNEEAAHSVIKDGNDSKNGHYAYSEESISIHKYSCVKELNGIISDGITDTNLEYSCHHESNNQKTNCKTELCNENNSGFVMDKNGIKDSKDLGRMSSSDAAFNVKVEISDSNISVEEVGNRVNILDNSQSLENKLNMMETAKEENAALKSEVVKDEHEESIKTETEEDSEEEILQDLGNIELVAESMEEIRNLIHKLSNPEPTKKGKRLIPGVVKPCEEELIASLTGFLEELSKYERSLCNARLEMQAKLRKEFESYVEPKIEEVKDWESDSQSSRDSSEDEESDNKADVDSAKQIKKGRQKPPASTPVPSSASKLSSAASKLSSLTDDKNEDSNDSFDLDISSRGRLRKRRVIPNNTEDTGLKRRKNLQNQDSFFPTISTGSSTIITTTPALGQQTAPSSIVSLLKSSSVNSAIKAQLTSQISRADDQRVQLISLASGGAHSPVQVGKSGIVRTTLHLSNICVVSSPGVNAVPRSKVLTSSSAQISHPVIQQMLLNQTRISQPSNVTTPNLTTMSSSGLPLHLSGARVSILDSTSCAAKTSVVIKVPSPAITTAATKSLNMFSKSPAPVAITLVSPPVSQGGKQVIDLGSLSISQLQQLIKNQAVQIHTGAGAPATLLLTAGLQQPSLPHALTGTPTSISVQTPTRVILPVNQPGSQVRFRTPGASLLTVGSNMQLATSLTPPKFSSLQTVSTQIPRKTILSTTLATHPQTPVKVNTANISQTAGLLFQGLSNSPLQSFPRTTSLIPAISAMMLVSPTQLGSISKNSNNLSVKNVVSLTAAQKYIPAPRIISSLAPTGPGKITLGATSALSAQTSSENYSVVISGSNPRVLNPPDTFKSGMFTFPLVSLSPSKSPAYNLTVKALLENRGAKKSKEDDSDTSTYEQQKIQASFFKSGSTLSLGEDASNIENAATAGTPIENNKGESEIGKTFAYNNAIELMGETGSFTVDSYPSATDVHGQAMITPTFYSTINSLTHPISVDTGISSINTFPTEINLPTMNIKVPCPSTLPSLQHNKNGTTIVQSTKVPIPVATEAKSGDSLSPSMTIVPASVHQGTTFHTVCSSSKNNPTVENLVMLPGDNTSVLSAVRTLTSNQTISGNHSQLMSSGAGLKNILLKVTPQGQGPGQLVRGFMTSQGLVIPQTALLQQGHPAGSATVLTPGALAQLQPGSIQIQPSSVLGTAKQQTVLSFNTAAQGMKQQQLAPNILVASPASLTSNLCQDTNPNFQVMLVKAPPHSAVNSNNTTTSVTNQQKQTTTTTPASELVKQIVSNTQVLAGLQQKVTVDSKSCSPGGSQQNAVQLLNTIGSGFHHGSGNASLPAQKVVTIPTTISPQLTAQILALQQHRKLQEHQQAKIVLTAKPVQNQGILQSQNKPSAVTFQVQQSGQLSNITAATQQQVSGVPQIQQLQGTSIQQIQGTSIQQSQGTSIQQSQGTSIQQLLSSRVAHSNQVLQLAIRPPGDGKALQAVPNHSQAIHVSGLQSSQPQLTNQRLALIQPNGKIVIQQPSSQRVILQPVLAPNTISIQPSINQVQMSALQQHSSKTLLQSAQRSNVTTVNKVQFASNALTHSQQLVGSSQVPNLVISQLQVPAVCASSSTLAQPQAQFFINPSTNSMSTLSFGSTSSILPSVNKVQVENMNHLIKADSSIAPASLNSQPTGIKGFPQPNEYNHTMTLGGSALSASTPAAKSDMSLTIPYSIAEQHVVSPINMNFENQQMNITNPFRVVYAQTQGSSSGSTSCPVGVNNQFLKKAVASSGAANQENSGSVCQSLFSGIQNNVHNQAVVKPSVIYAGQPSVVSDRKEGSVAHILQSQPAVNITSGQINNHLQSTARLQASSSDMQHGTDHNNSLTFVYRIGDQYFSPTTNVGQLISQNSLSATSLATPGIVTTTSRPEVQLLVPPAFIEASDQILKQNIKTQASFPQMPSLASASLDVVPGNTNQSVSQLLSHDRETDVTQSPIGTADSVSQMSKTSVNGIHMVMTTQGSMPLSSSLYMTNKQSTPVCDTVDSIDQLGEPSSRAGNPDNSGSVFESLLNIQNLHSANVDTPPSIRNTSDTKIVRRNTISASQSVLTCHKGPTAQTHLSSDDLSLFLEDQDEKEAAMNLLTLANQQI